MNYNEDYLSLFKEVRTLQCLDVHPPIRLRVECDSAKGCYSNMTAVRSALLMYERVMREADGEVLGLAAAYHAAVRELLRKGVKEKLTWQNPKLRDFISQFTQAAYTLQEKVDQIAVQVLLVRKLKLEVARCPYAPEAFAALLQRMQDALDALGSLRCVGLPAFIQTLNEEVQAALVERASRALGTWLVAFRRRLREESADMLQEEEAIREELEAAEEPEVYRAVLRLNSVHLIRVVSRTLVVNPPVAESKKRWLDSLLAVVSTVTALPRLHPLTDLLAAREEAGEQRFSGVTDLIPPRLLLEALDAVEALMAEVGRFVGTWLRNQAVWRLNPKEVSEKLGSNVGLWQELLTGLARAKSELDTASTEKVVGCIHINLEQIQSSMSLRYDSLHKDLLAAFAALVFTQTQAFVKQVGQSRGTLEQLSINASTAEAINLILATREVTHCLPLWKAQRDQLLTCQRLLEQQGFAFPAEWVYSQQVENDWSCLEQIVARRQEAIKAAQEQLKQSVVAEDAKLKATIQEAQAEWEEQKPLEGDVSVETALEVLRRFRERADALSEKWTRVNKGRDALGLDVHLENPLELVLTELAGLQEAWESVQPFWARVAALGDTMWSVFVPKTASQELTAVECELETVPSRVKQYACFTTLQGAIRSHKKDFKLLSELKGSALKERHWSVVLGALGVHTSVEFLRVRDFWTPAFHEKEEKIAEVLATAQGEKALEEYLRQVREFWSGYVLELVAYGQRCKLIRGWEELFQQLDEHISALESMKQSPYYRVFAEEAEGWCDKLTRMRVLFDMWIDVQRRWVYLEGIFMGGADIVQQLPQDYARFKTIDTEFVSTMRKVSVQPRVLDVFGTANIQRTLERLSQQLAKVQKALGAFLERQRQLFSRFYFVGDEDLLEIIGNSNDPKKLQRHLNKMFAGINALEYVTEEGAVELRAMVSKEGEVVPFAQPVRLEQACSVVTQLQRVEQAMQETLAVALEQALAGFVTLEGASFVDWIARYPSQIILLATQVVWCRRIEAAFQSSQSVNQGGQSSQPVSGDGQSAETARQLEATVEQIDALLGLLAESVLHPLPVDQRKKHEQLITEFVYEKGTTQSLLREGTASAADFNWQYRLRAYYDESEPALLRRLTIRVADSCFNYGYEYLGVCERLVQTPLTDRCYLTLTQALAMGLGGNPFGPAGTGKTESVKMLASLLGRFCLVFNCDESFDFQAMGRIFRGLCQVGAWGCFDEFNRLEERILSAVSQQIWTIQTGLRHQQKEIRLLDTPVALHPNVGIFVTMNPGYAGRSNLPDNLKQLFRSIAMIQPDWERIAQVMLFSQGFRSSETLAGKLVLLFSLCHDQLSAQLHYDFGLRALKSVVTSAGNLKRHKLEEGGKELLAMDAAQQEAFERDVLLSSVCDTVVPKLVAEDIPLLQSLLGSVFTGAAIKEIEAMQLRAMIREVCRERKLVPTEAFVEKVLQLFLVQQIRHGIMMVGPSGSGKSSVIHCLLEALERVDGQQGVIYTIDPKAITKDQLFGSLDTTTNEWTDGIFTHIIRQIYNDVRGESARRHWIVFDGDVDPEWAENLNSVLDDNRLLTLPTGDRLSLPDNVRILFEVENLKFATPASVSRCGTVWLSQDTVATADLLQHTLLCLRADPVVGDLDKAPLLALQNRVADVMVPYCDEHCLLEQSIAWSLARTHIMETTATQLVGAFAGLLRQLVLDVVDYNMEHMETPMAGEHFLAFVANRLVEAALWGFGGSLVGDDRLEFSEMLRAAAGVTLPPGEHSLLDCFVSTQTGQWTLWREHVPAVQLQEESVLDTSVVVPTVDTARNEHVMRAYLNARQPVILCGPPGSGKTMTLTNALRSLSGFDVVSVNFSSKTLPSLIMKIFDQYGVYHKTPGGLVLRPAVPDKWLIIFCDEVNLPEQDAYGTQRVISFLRQLVEHQGFWNTKEHLWVHVENIQFVAACNPPTDPGRVPLSTRFLSHAPVLFVDYPEEASLLQIYSVFNRVLLQGKPGVAALYGQLTEAMVRFYSLNKQHFSLEQQPQYVYSPRELSRWTRALHAALSDTTIPVNGGGATSGVATSRLAEEDVTPEELVRLAAHEALRLFCDRLVTQKEKEWCQEQLEAVFASVFPGVRPEALRRPILYSRWLTGRYSSVDRASLRAYLESQLRVFNEEELNVPLVLFDDVLEHVVRIDRVLRQSLGHLLLVGESGAGKTVLTRFVAWLNGMNVFQIKLSRRYNLESFDEDLRQVMRAAGVNGEPTCFIFDESNILSTGFLERMNALLASGEVPGLYEGDDMLSLMAGCRDAAAHEGLLIDTSEELFRWFTARVQRNLHVVFTMNPANGDFRDRAATSPALFNRCVVDWFGRWERDALLQVSQYFTRSLELDRVEYYPSEDALRLVAASRGVEGVSAGERVTLHDALMAAILSIHQSVVVLDEEKSSDTRCYCSPRDYLDFINQYLALFQRKHEELEEQRRHLQVGLTKLQETESQVIALREQVSRKSAELDRANLEAQNTLRQIVEKKELATKDQETSSRLAKELTQQYGEIKAKQAEVRAELDKVEPALEEAKNSVSQINKAQLNEIRAMIKPPDNVQLTIKAVCCLLGEESGSWKEIQKVLRKEDFISRIVNFQTQRITKRGAEEAKKILYDPNFTFEAVNRSSRACGPLYMWGKSQLEYAYHIQRVKPLNDAMEGLTEKSEALRQEHGACMERLGALNEEIERCSSDYGAQAQKVQQITAEIREVTEKLERSSRLLTSLESEQRRWRQSSEEFAKEETSMTGDCLLGASFVTYGGFFDQHHRAVLLSQWTSLLSALCIPFNPNFDAAAYLSSSKDRLAWQSCGLPSDDLCMQNAIILNRFNRYPLLVDPSEQGVTFLMNLFSSSLVVKTSFLDKNFMRQLESALRFGSVLIVQDVENADPILNPLLNKEFHKEGGRTLIRIGGQDIDFSPSFKLFLSTRDSSHQFPPDLCSRVTFVNFTMTVSSLQDQCLSLVLQKEAPSLYQQRNNVLQLQGEYQVRLRDLEEQLLSSLNALRGNILDNDTVMNTLEQLKTEAASISKEMSQSEEIMRSIRESSRIYQPLSQACSQIYFILDSLHRVRPLYRYSLHFFTSILQAVLATPLDASLPPSQRMTLLLHALYREVYARVSRGLTHLDSRVLALRLCQLYVQGTPEQPDPEELQLLLKGISVSVDPTAEKFVTAVFGSALSEEQEAQMILHLSIERTKALKRALLQKSAFWAADFRAAPLEALLPCVDEIGEEGWSRGRALWRWLLLVKELRPELLVAAIEHVVTSLCDADFFKGEVFALRDVVVGEASAKMPVLLCSAPGYDASKRVEQLYAELQTPLESIAMGNAESFEQAERAIRAAAARGTAVLLRNVHLCPEWLCALEKLFFTLNAQPDFRLLLTSEISPKLPPSLLRLCYTLVFETPTGVRASLLHSLSAVPEECMNAKPVERCRVCFLLLWLHAVVEERLRYVPVGWTKPYEFNESDLKCALEAIDHWVSAAARGLPHMDPARLNWKALRALLSQCFYGGRVDNAFDDLLLRALIDRIFVPASFNSDFPLVEVCRLDGVSGVSGVNGSREVLLTVPEGTCKADFERWVDALPVYNSPEWLGLPATAEKRYLSQQGSAILRAALLLQDAAGQEARCAEEGAKEREGAWASGLAGSAEKWLGLVMVEIKAPASTPALLRNPLFRFLAREIEEMKALQATVVRQLQDLVGVCQGKLKSTHATRLLLEELARDRVPRAWCRGGPDAGEESERTREGSPVVCSVWVQHFILRCQHFAALSTLSVEAVRTSGVWLGGLLHPEAFIIAMRQLVAQERGWPLNDVQLRLTPLSPERFEHVGAILAEKESAFLVHSLVLEGADWSEEGLVPSDAIRCPLDEVLFEWSCEKEEAATTIQVPIYLNDTRSQLLYVVDLKHVKAIPTEMWRERAVSIICWRQI